MYCQFENIDKDDKPWKCKNCGYKCKVNAKRGCTKPQASSAINTGPSFIEKVSHFGKAIVKDLSNGMERCTDEEMDARLAICKECPFYIKKDETQGSCAQCGCSMSRDRVYLNKIAWKSESCPINKW